VKTAQSYLRYPAGIIVLTVLFSLLIYLIGPMILYQAGLVWLLLYLGYLLFLEIRLIFVHCPNCYYYNRVCAFGRGKFSGLFFKKGRTEKFSCNPFTWKGMIPDLMVFLMPVTAGIILLVLDFSGFLLMLMILFTFLNFSGNAFIRGHLACNHCKQAEMGCPALKLFNRGKT
jgi:hypothetical protein